MNLLVEQRSRFDERCRFFPVGTFLSRTIKHMANKLCVGFIGSGFVTKFHLQAWRGVRDADVLGIYSPNPDHAAATAALARELRVGNASPFNSIEEMVAAPHIDCLWLCGPNDQRLQNMQAICDADRKSTRLNSSHGYIS